MNTLACRAARVLQSAVVCLALIGSLPVSGEAQIATPKTPLEGSWRTTGIERNGKVITAPEAIEGMHLTFADDMVLIRGLYGKQEERVRFTTVETTSPKQLDWTRPDGTRVMMLYELNGNDLRIAFGFLGSKDRPKVISGASGSQAVVMSFKRDGKVLP